MKTVILKVVHSICAFLKAHVVISIVTGAAIVLTAVGTPATVITYRHHQAVLAEEQRIAAELAEQEAAAKAEVEKKAKEEAEAKAKAEAEQKAKEEAAAKAEAEKKAQEEPTKQEAEQNQKPEATKPKPATKPAPETNKKPESANSNSGSTAEPPVVQTANTDTGISWDGKSPIVYTYPDGTQSTTPIDGATYEVVPGCTGTYEAPAPDSYADAADGICQYCGKKEWDGANGTCLRLWAGNGQDCSNCGVFVPVNTCHTCTSGCKYCKKTMGDGRNGTCYRNSYGDTKCPSCNIDVSMDACHSCD